MNIRLEPARKNGLWLVEIAAGNKKKKTRVSVPVTATVYTLAQAQAFISNNKVSDFSELLPCK